MVGKLTESSLVVRNIRIRGDRTSIKLEPVESAALDRICTAENLTIHEFCEQADRDPARTEGSRTGRIRMAILDYFAVPMEGMAEGRRERPSIGRRKPGDAATGVACP